MRGRPVFADPKTDFVFHRIFGSEEHKGVLIAFLNDILELDEAHRVLGVTFLPPEQRPKIEELKRSIVDVKCVDARGIQYVVEMQVLNTEAFEKRVVYNVAKAYTNQLNLGDGYPKLNDIIGITICDFEIWKRAAGSTVPMLSRWRMQEQKSGEVGLLSLQFVFLELPKYDRQGPPETMIEKWAYFFREADHFEMAPAALHSPAFEEALEAARTARFSVEEWDAYIRAGMEIQNERGMLTYAEKEGEKRGEKRGLEVGRKEGREQGLREGLREGLRQGIRDLCEVLAIELTTEREKALQAMDEEALAALRERMKRDKAWG